MKNMKKQSGFTAVELLITLFIAAAFLMSGYQLYSLIMKDGGEVRATARASNIAYDYIQQYKSYASSPCSAKTPINNQTITVDTLSSVTITVSITCPYSTATSISKVSASISYGTPQQTVNNATYINLSTTTSGAAAATTSPQGPLSPGTMADDATIGTVAWTSPDNAKVSDNVYSSVTISDNQTTHYLKATNFGVAASFGPSGASTTQVDKFA